MKSYLHTVYKFLPLIALVILAKVSYGISVQNTLAGVGIENAFLFIFAFAFLAGLSTLSGIPYYLVFVTFAASGLNPWILGIVAALGTAIGDSATYGLAYWGQKMFTGRGAQLLERLKALLARHPRLTPLAFFLYGACIPYSNDVVVLPAGFARYPIWLVIPPLFVGTIIFNIVLAHVAFYAYPWLIPFL